MRKLYRSRDNKVLAGICGGLAEYFEVDASIVRLVTLALVLLGGVSIWIYIIAIFLIPLEPENYHKGYYDEDNNDKDFY